MHQKTNAMIVIAWIVISILISGCDERIANVAQQAADRQAQQNTMMGELNKEVASGTRSLIQADAATCREITAVHRDIQAERARLDSGWTMLGQRNEALLSERRVESLFVTAIHAGGLLGIVIMLLGYCWYALFTVRVSRNPDAELYDLLIRDLSANEPQLVEFRGQVAALPKHVNPHLSSVG